MIFVLRKLAPGTAAVSLAACAAMPPLVGASPGSDYDYRLIEPGGEAAVRAHVLTIDLTRPDLRFGVTPGDTSLGMEYVARLTSAYLEETGAKVAINASYFLPFKGGSEGGSDYYPHVGQAVSVSGAALSNGRATSPVETHLDERVDSIICFAGAHVVIEDGQVCPDGYADGVAAGPRLLEAGRRLDFRDAHAGSRHPRTAIGVSADRKTAWIVVVDGRQTSRAGQTLPELADLFVGLGAADAINLDGGGSSTLAVDDGQGHARILNSPIHTKVPGRERPVANHIALFWGDDR
ncbi:MAG: phosphodiester glycosidase family protein [Proteobacteria bacterium]|nr:phosphodiester glycosidase family protein [Pseudomonadota bacterium]